MIEASTGKLLYALNPDRELAIASTTKLMTALVTLQHVGMGATFTYPDYYLAPVDSQIGLVPGDRMSVHDLLIAMLLPSAGDAAEDLAWGVGRGSVPRFLAMMNAEARRLGLRHTHYSTAIGLDTPGNYSTARDLVTLARWMLHSQPFFRRVVALPRALVGIDGRPRVVTNLNSLIGSVPWVNGVKTGHTLDAGYVLVGSGTRHGMTLISAVLGAPSESARESDTLALLQYGFGHFRLLTPIRKGKVLARLEVSGYPGQRAELIAAGTFRLLASRSTRVRVVIQAPAQLTGPLPWHALIGRAYVQAGASRVAVIALLLAHALPAPPESLLDRVGAGPFTLLVVASLLAASVVLRRLRRSG
jgi:serine-type D-Ala-D-Ala carboxypeptidase (penicillin-binding protein 5/6)